MNKACSICGIVKPLGDFQTGRNQCKICKQKKDAKVRVRPEDDQDSLDMRALIMQLQRLPMIAIEELPQNERYIKLKDALQDALVQVDIMSDNTRLVLRLKIPEELHVFLASRAGDSRKSFANVRTAKMYLTDQKFEAGFEEHFGVKRSTLAGYVGLLDDIDNIVGFVAAAYYGLVDLHLTKTNTVFVEPNDFVSDHEMRKDIGVHYDPTTDSIVAYGNPLRINKSAFLAGLDELIVQEHYNVMGWKKAGYYDKLKALLV